MKDFIKWMGWGKATFGIATLLGFFVISLIGGLIRDDDMWWMSFVFVALAGVVLVERVIKYDKGK